MADPAPAAPPSPAPSRQSPPPTPASPAPAPGSLTGTRYDAPISDQAYDRLGPESQGKYARVRDAANNPTWQPRSDLAPDPAPKPAAPPAPGEPPAPPASVVDGRLSRALELTRRESLADQIIQQEKSERRDRYRPMADGMTIVREPT
jgi:hypothetical protein